MSVSIHTILKNLKQWSLLTASLLIVSGVAMQPLVQADAASPNLMLNPSAESVQNAQPLNWTSDNWGNGISTLTTTSDAQDGTTALITTVSGKTSGDAKWMPDPVNITAGQQYTYGDYSKSTTATQLIAAYTTTAGIVSYSYLGAVSASTVWQQNSLTFTAPTGATQLRVLHILSTDGTLTTDNFSLVAQTIISTPPPSGNNLIANPSMSVGSANTPAGWQTDNWGTNSATFSYLTTDGHTDTRSAFVQLSNYTDGDAKWYFNPVSVTPGTTYTYSDFYKASVTSNIVVRYDDGTGKYAYAAVATPAASGTWNQSSITFTTPATAKLVTVLHTLSSNGTLQIDDASLTAAAPVAGNLYSNPSVETPDAANSRLPAGWRQGGWGTNTSAYTYATAAHTGTRAIKVQINSYTNGAAYWTGPTAKVSGGLYSFSDYYKSSIPSEVDASVVLADGTTQDMYLGTAFASPNSWTKYETQFTIPAGATAITIYHNIYKAGYLTTDDYSLSAFNYQGFNRALVSITDDDGFASLYANGLPVLQKYGLPSTAYMISGYIGAPGYMTSTQLLALKASGVEIGSHSVDHADLSTLTAAGQTTELKNSQTTLQNLLGSPVTSYAAPYGAYNQQIVTKAQQYYTSYRGVQSGYNARNNFDPMNLRVQNITSTTTTADVQRWLQQAAQTNTWLVLVYHEIDTQPNDHTYNTLPSDFDAQMSAVKNSGLVVQTMAQALAEIKAQL